MRVSRWVTAMVSAAVLSLVAVAPALASSALGWRVYLSRHYGTASSYPGYTSVIALAKNDAWALGASDLSYNSATSQEAVAEHWNGASWNAVPMPAGTDAPVIAAGAISATNIWAAASAPDAASRGYILHWDGARWLVAKHFTGIGELSGVAAVSATDVWVFGGPGGNPGLGTWHYNGKTWQQVTGSAIGLENASAVSADNIWAIGSSAVASDQIVAHYDGTTWQSISAPALSGLDFHTIRAFSVTNVWATANDHTKTAYPPVLLHYDGKQWTRSPIPWNVVPTKFASDGAGGLWIISVAPASGSAQYLLHRTATGTWTREAPPAGTFDLALTPGTTSLWGGGTVKATAGQNAAIEAYGQIP